VRIRDESMFGSDKDISREAIRMDPAVSIF
jgi:hypothetical protein